MLASRWNQHRIRIEAGKHTPIALTSPGAPSEVMVVGIRSPRLSIERKNSVQQASDSLLPTARCSRCLRAVGGDAPADQQCLLRPVPAQRLKHRIDEQVLHLDAGQVAADEGLVVLPQPVGDLADRGLGDQQLPGRVPEGVLHVPGGQAAGVHLVDQRLQHLTVAVQEPHQRGPERLGGAADLRHRHVDEPLRGAQPAPLIAVPRAGLILAAAVVAAAAAEEVALLALQQLLHHQPGHRLHQRRDDVGLAVGAAGQQTAAAARERSRTGLPFSSACSFDRRSSTPDMIEQATSIYRNARTPPLAALHCRFRGGRGTAVNANRPREALDVYDEARWAVGWWYRHVQCQLVDRPGMAESDDAQVQRTSLLGLVRSHVTLVLTLIPILLSGLRIFAVASGDRPTLVTLLSTLDVKAVLLGTFAWLMPTAFRVAAAICWIRWLQLRSVSRPPGAGQRTALLRLAVCTPIVALILFALAPVNDFV